MRATFLVCLAALAALTASTALADVLQLRDGRLIPGKVVTLDDRGVDFAPESGGRMHVDWDSVVPLSRYDLWQSSLATDDAAGRVALAKWALSVDLYPYARRELVRAKGLGYSGPEKVEELVAQVDREEADTVLSETDSLIDEGELEKALERVRTYLRSATLGDDANRVRARVPDILARIESRDAQEKEADAAKEKAAKAGKLKEWIEKNLGTAAASQTEAGNKAASGYENLAKGNQTRARADLGAAETGFQSARSTYRRVKKAAGAGEVADRCDREIRDCDRRTVAVLVRLGRMEVENKAWKRASPIVDRGLKIDPVDRELLELRRTIDENWLRRKASDISNAHPHESN